MADLCHTAAAGRARFAERLAVTGSDAAVLAQGLRAASAGEGGIRIARERLGAGAPQAGLPVHRTGQPSAPAWAWLLARSEPLFAAALQRAAAALAEEMDPGLMAVLGDGSLLADTAHAQPALVALECALADQWRAWGIEPAVVLGHSVGEYAAAYAAGMIALEDAVRLAARRGRLMRELTALGAMAAVTATPEAAAAAIAGIADLCIAANNGPERLTLAGTPQAIEQALAALAAANLPARRLDVSRAFHSPLMEPMLPAFAQVLATQHWALPRMSFISSMTGQPADNARLSDPAYWVEQLRAPVAFAEACRSLRDMGATACLELGPAPTLLALARENNPDLPLALAASLRPGTDEPLAMRIAASHLWTAGFEPQWNAINPKGKTTSAPHYPFQRKRHWLAAPGLPQAGVALEDVALPTYAARRLRSPGLDKEVFECLLSPESPAFLKDHKISGNVVVAGATYVAMIASAVAELTGQSAFRLEKLRFSIALLLAGECYLQVVFTRESPISLSVEVLSRRAGSEAWSLHASAEVVLEVPKATGSTVAELLVADMEELSTQSFYEGAWNAGYELGTSFRRADRLWRGEGRVVAAFRTTSGDDDEFHPGLVDSCFQICGSLLGDEQIEAMARDEALFIPAEVETIEIYAQAPPAWCIVTRQSGTANELVADIQVIDAAGSIVARFTGFLARRTKRAALEAQIETLNGPPLLALHWIDKPLAENSASRPGGGRWLVIAPEGEAVAAFQARLSLCGEPTVRIEPPDDPAALRQKLIAALEPNGDMSVRGIVLLSGLSQLRDPPGTPLEAAIALSVDAVRIVQAVAASGYRDPPRLYLVSRRARSAALDDALPEPDQAVLSGLAATIAHEHPELQCTLVDLDSEASMAALERELRAGNEESRVALRGQRRLVARLARAPATGPPAPAKQSSEHRAAACDSPFRLEMATPGLLESMTLRRFTPRPLLDNEVAIAVEASGINFVDVLLARGILPADAGPGSDGRLHLGGECSGRIVALGTSVTGFEIGQEVMAIAPDSLASIAITAAALVRPRPARLDMVAAAGTPIAYLTAYLALVDTAHLRNGESVLIHAASGGVGLAAIHVAKRIGAHILATAGLPEKRAFLKTRGIEHVFDSRSRDFAKQTLDATGGKGVDVVLNCLSGAAIEAGFEALADGGRFVEIGKRDYLENRALGLGTFLRNRSLSLVDLRGMCFSRAERVGKAFLEVEAIVREDGNDDAPMRTFPVALVEDAFRALAGARHIGKLVVKLGDTKTTLVSHPALHRLGRDGFARKRSGYLISGGFGALGIAVAQKLVERGADEIVLIGRSGAKGPAARTIAELRDRGVTVHEWRLDISDSAALKIAVASLEAPLRGVIHCAAVLDDAILLRMETENLRRVMTPKIAGAWNLHEATAEQPLDFFVMFSSAAALFGAPGQGNYAAANAYLDALAHYRRALGLPALSINWGPWDKIGLAAATQERRHGVRSWAVGIAAIVPDEGMGLFEQLTCDYEGAQVGVISFDARAWQQTFPRLAQVPLFSEILAGAENAANRNNTETPLRRELASAEPESRRALLQSYILRQICLILSLPDHAIAASSQFGRLGFDSLMALEFRNRIETGLGISLPPTLIWTHRNTVALSDHILNLLGLADDDAPAPAAPAMYEEDLDALTDAQVAELLMSKLGASERSLP